MALTLMYITNRPEVALIAQKAGVDRIWIDMEHMGKEERQAGMNTVKSHHTIADIKRIRPYITTSELLVRVNPLHENSKREIEDTLVNGADIIMLPMFRTAQDAQTFVDYVDGRAKTILLVETAEAVDNIEDILRVQGIDEVHVGLNDLHLAYHKTFMFELLCDGTVERLSAVFREHGVRFGFGGIARIGHGDLPAEFIIGEHYRLGSKMAILSRGFCNANATLDMGDIENAFADGVLHIREKEAEIQRRFTQEDFVRNHALVEEKVLTIVKKKREGA